MGNELDLNSVLNYPISKDGIAKFYGIYINPNNNNNKGIDETFDNYKFSKDMKKEKH